jgi:DNA-binding transcriptional LysR family regulator
MTDRLMALEMFVRIVENGSFTAAADQLGLSRAAVSKHMAALEDRLDVRLLNRTTRRCSLTEAGQAFYERCRQILGDLEDAEREAGQTGLRPKGTLKVNAPMSFGTMYLAPAIPDFLGLYPEVSIDMTLNDRVVDLLEEGFDVAIRIGRLADSSLVARRLAPSRIVACAAPSYIARRGTPSAPAELGLHDCLVYAYAPNRDVWEFTGPSGPVTVKVRGRLRANNGEALVAAAAAGFGIVWSPTFMVDGLLADGRLVPILEDFPIPERGVYAVWPHGRHLSAKVRSFVDFLAARFGPEPFWDAWAAPASRAKPAGQIASAKGSRSRAGSALTTE